MWNRSRPFQIACICLSVFFVSHAQAAISSTLGEQDFEDGKRPVYSSEISLAGIGEPFPFDGTHFGTDPGGILGDFSYTHTFSLGGQSVYSASITIGLMDHDSFSIGNDTINIFFDGVQQDDSMWLGISQSPSSVSVRSMNVAPSLLLDEALTVRILATEAAQGHPGNSIQPDFSLLTINTGEHTVPEPMSLALVVIGLFGFPIARIRRR